MRVLHGRHYQAAVGRRRDPQVHVVLDDDLLSRLVPGRVDHRMPGSGDKQRFCDQDERGEPDAPELRKRPQADRRGHCLGDVDLQEFGDMRRGEGAGRHRGSRVLAHAADRNTLLARQRC